jgi:glutamate-1-semialdehyde 2,1-aminomutase
MNLSERTNKLKARATAFIPAGAHTYSRADNQFPENAPSFVAKAKGCLFWDENGTEYIDYGMGLLSVSIGHANEIINAKVMAAIHNGTSYSRPSLLEGELAEKINSLIPSAEMVKFAKNGSDVTSAAIRLARNYTGKKYIVRCSQQPFLSFNDWFIASTSKPGGVPAEMAEWILRFDYNDIKSLEAVFDAHKNEIACVIMEPFTNEFPQPGFLDAVKMRCEKNGALLIFDEMITGFRTAMKGAQHTYNVVPHLSTFGKGLANGFPLAVLCGQKEIMQQGNMSKEVFLLSCTFGGETTGLSAGLATIEFMQEHNALQHIASYGEKLMKVFNASISKYELNAYIRITGHPARPELKFFENGLFSFALKTLFMQEMMRQGIFMERIAISYSHTEEALLKTTAALENTFKLIAEAIRTGSVKQSVNGKIIEPVFTK